MHKMAISAAAGALLVAGLIAPASAADVVTAVQVAKPPVLAAGRPIRLGQGQGADRSAVGRGELQERQGQHHRNAQGGYSGDMLYVLLQYDDPTQSVRRFPYQKQADGTWKKLKDANDKGGDDNVYYEDKFALIWNINNSIKGFDKQGCMTACHAGEPGKPFGNKYTQAPANSATSGT